MHAAEAQVGAALGKVDAADQRSGVHVFNPAGKLIGRIDLPERCANLSFGGVDRNRLFMAASTAVYSLYVNTQGVAYA